MLNVVASKARGEASMSAKNGSIKLVAGNSNPSLAQAIAGGLSLPLTKAVVRRFADMEIFVEIQENVRGSDAFIIQSTSFPANDHLMELLIITDALRRSSARRITAVIPYFGYARQDRKSGSRTPISAKLVANLITRAGIDRVMTIDLHAATLVNGDPNAGGFISQVAGIFGGFTIANGVTIENLTATRNSANPDNIQALIESTLKLLANPTAENRNAVVAYALGLQLLPRARDLTPEATAA